MKALLPSSAGVLALSLALAQPLCAATEAANLSEFDPRIRRAETEILENRYRRARRLMMETAHDHVTRIAPGVRTEALLRMVALHRALAEAGLGNEEDARWYYHMALAFNPLLTDYGLDRFGAPGRFLLHATPAEAEPSRAEHRAGPDSRQAEESPSGRVTFPRVEKRSKISFPRGASAFGLTGILLVRVTVTEEGKPVHPRIIKPLPASTLTWTALEAIRTWRFEPARLDGEPVAAPYNLTINYYNRE